MNETVRGYWAPIFRTYIFVWKEQVQKRMPAVEAMGLEVTYKPPARKVAPRCVHVGCADEQVELKTSGLWVVRLDGPETEIRLLEGRTKDSHSNVDGGVR